MFEESRNTAMALGARDAPTAYRHPSVLERLTDEKARCEHRLAQVNDALALLEKNPDVALVLETLSKIGF